VIKCSREYLTSALEAATFQRTTSHSPDTINITRGYLSGRGGFQLLSILLIYLLFESLRFVLFSDVLSPALLLACIAVAESHQAQFVALFLIASFHSHRTWLKIELET
jgi:hypothetical protein